MHGHQLVELSRDAPAGQGQPHRDLQAFPVPFIDHGEQPDAATVVERVGHEIDRPGEVQPRGRSERLTVHRGYALDLLAHLPAHDVNLSITSRLSLEPSPVACRSPFSSSLNRISVGHFPAQLLTSLLILARSLSFARLTALRAS